MSPSLRDRFRRRSPPTTAATASSTNSILLGGSLGRRSNHSDNGSSSHSSSSNSHSLYGPHTNTGGLSSGGGGRMRGLGGGGGLRRSGRRNNHPQQPQRPPLAAFDACVEACDALAASAAPRHHERREEAPTGEGALGHNNEEGGNGEEATSGAATNEGSGRESLTESIPDCSVLVSPDGALLFTSSQSRNVLHLKDAHDNHNTEGSNGEGSDATNNPNNTTNSNSESSRYPWTNIPAAHRDTTLLREDYASAILCGNDLSPRGDRDANGFSARGWHPDAASSALASSRDALQQLAGFAEDVAAINKEGGMRVADAADKWGCARRNVQEQRRGAGPLAGGETTVARAMEALEGYYAGEARGNAERWTRACSEGRQLRRGRAGAESSRRSNSSEAETIELREIVGSGVEGGEDNRPTQSSKTDDDAARMDGLLPALRSSTQKAALRTANRERALHDVRAAVAEAQATLQAQKAWAKQCHQRVSDEEANVDRLFAIKKMEHYEAYEEWRREQEGRALVPANQDEVGGEGETTTTMVVEEGPLSDEVWQMLGSISDMESFGHTGYSPTAASKQTMEVDGVKMAAVPPPPNQSSRSRLPAPHDHLHRTHPPPPRLISRDELERESDLRDLRAVARVADDSVEDAAGTLLNAMSAGDTALRSARLAAETGLLSECHAAQSCLQSLVALEKAALEEKRARLEALERAVDAIDVRGDLDTYIAADKSRPGGRSRAGDEDDGGIAAALAVLNSHGEGERSWAGSRRGHGNVERGDYFQGWGAEDDDDDGGGYREEDDGVEPELFTDIIGGLFGRRTAANAAGGGADDRPEGADQVALAAKALAEPSSRGQSHRKSVLYELNTQRSRKTRIEGRSNFNALCSLFDAFLSGCAREPVDVANAKMLMILSQTFYLVDDGEEEEAEEEMGSSGNGNEEEGGRSGNDVESTADKEKARTPGRSRQDRVYVKSRICHHDIWSDPSFWDQAVYQCVSESLAKSGVLLNYVGADDGNGDTGARDPRDVRWHDLPPAEYAGAAAQVHSVVFAQLGTLSHSMIELGCGIPRAVGFVRRLSVRYQLPLSLRITLIQHLTRKQRGGNAS